MIVTDTEVTFSPYYLLKHSKPARKIVNCRLAKFMGNNEKIAMVNSFAYSSFNYCPLAWLFCSCESWQKIEKLRKRCLRLVL